MYFFPKTFVLFFSLNSATKTNILSLQRSILDYDSYNTNYHCLSVYSRFFQ